MISRRAVPFVFLLSLSLAACDSAPRDTAAASAAAASGSAADWAIAIHGGAGSSPDSRTPAENDAYLAGLRTALQHGVSVLDGGGAALDAVEQVIRLLEDDPLFNAGKGAVFNHDGGHELDASLMDGASLACGAVAGVTTVKNPISLARLVMERTRHVLLAGAGADRFAEEMDVERVDQDYFYTEARHESLQRVLEDERRKGEEHGTVGVVALDRKGNLAAGTSTGGLTGKKHGRVGDSPIIGAGTYAKNATCAVSGTGVGEEYIRHGIAQRISDLMEYRELSLDSAVNHVVHEILRSGDGGVIAVDHNGAISMAFNTPGMARGAADSTGRFDVQLGH